MKKIVVSNRRSYAAVAAAGAQAIHPYPYDYQKYRGLQPNSSLTGIRIGEWLDANDKSVCQLANMCKAEGLKYGIKFGTTSIYHYLYGICRPKEAKLKILAKVMNVSVDYLTGC